MASTTARIGILFSATGPYALIATAMRNGALLAVDEVNADAALGVRLEPVVADPGGDLGAYSRLASGLLEDGVRHVVGCYTSSSRKEVIPAFEKRDALLWYPSHYEGFESSGNVVYTGATPNQHVIPLIEHMLGERRRDVYCVGSNYIWAWENNRIMRETLTARGGRVHAERYLPVGETDVAHIVDEIVRLRPGFVFNTLIGVSSYRFLRELRAAAQARGIDQVATFPVASCTLSEPELEAVGPEAVDGHISSSVYFSTIESAANAAFVARYRAAYPEQPTASADAEASYVAVHMLARALAGAGCEAIEPVKQAVSGFAFAAPQGEVRIDPVTLHARLTPRIGRSNASAAFDILHEATEPVAADPYLVENSPRFGLWARSDKLRLVR